MTRRLPILGALALGWVAPALAHACPYCAAGEQKGISTMLVLATFAVPFIVAGTTGYFVLRNLRAPRTPEKTP